MEPSAEPSVIVKRPRGHPPGSKNKPTPTAYLRNDLIGMIADPNGPEPQLCHLDQIYPPEAVESEAIVLKRLDVALEKERTRQAEEKTKQLELQLKMKELEFKACGKLVG